MILIWILRLCNSGFTVIKISDMLRIDDDFIAKNPLIAFSTLCIYLIIILTLIVHIQFCNYHQLLWPISGYVVDVYFHSYYFKAFYTHNIHTTYACLYTLILCLHTISLSVFMLFVWLRTQHTNIFFLLHINNNVYWDCLSRNNHTK